MIRSLRLKLTFLFLISFLLIYGLGAAVGLGVFYTGLSAVLDEEIDDLITEVMPFIEHKSSTPSLKKWAVTATQKNLSFPAGIQLFDQSGKLIESYGLCGGPLLKGEFMILQKGQKVRLRSSNLQLKSNGKPAGYLQIQVETDTRDDAIRQCSFTVLLILPFLSVAVAFAGFFFSGQAIKPVEKSIRVLQTFVADAGHEFITPVTVVEASIQTLEETLKDHGIGTEVLGIIMRASSRMKGLASDLIFLAKLDNPAPEMKMEKIDVGEFVEPALEEVAEIARAKGVEIACDNIPRLQVYGSADALKVMVSNLLSNAIKFTDTGGKVHVSVAPEGHRVNLIVEDNGIGIPQQNVEQIFDRFFRVDQSRSRSQGGSGLGLAIVKAILDAHKAQIEVQSALGRGSKFTVRMQRIV